jgi:hypothetical protein
VLVLDDLEEVLEELPERLVVGTGADGGMRPDPAALSELRRPEIEVDALPTGEAVRCSPGSTRRGRRLRST